MRGWEHFEHQADIGIRGYGPTLEAAFEEAATALVAVIADPARIKRRDEGAEVTSPAPAPEIMLFDWLNGLIYEMDTRRVLFGRFSVRISGSRLTGRAWGEKLDPSRHEPTVEVKAATFNLLEVRRREDGVWVAQCVVDV
ncbi:MAG TPA: archease [Kiritimatiellae bacterium]|nr:archease [Kiritimatiellia bacterium]